jgi:hypothetical protein
MRWSVTLALVRIHKGPNESPEVRRRETSRGLEDACFQKQKVGVVTIPDDRFPFYEASAQGIIYPYTLPFMQRHM